MVHDEGMGCYKKLPKVGKCCALVLAAGLLAGRGALGADPEVSNVRAEQRPGTQLVEITYDLADPDSAALTVSVAVSDNAGSSYAAPSPALRLTAALDVDGRLVISYPTTAGWAYTVEVSDDLWAWQTLVTNVLGDGNIATFRDPEPATSRQARFYRLKAMPSAPEGMALIPAGPFQMGDSFDEGEVEERPVHTVYVSAFYMDKFEVSKALWDEVYQWAIAHGYSFDNACSGKAADHPVHYVNWYDCVKWCNARSEREGCVPAYYTSAAQTEVYRTGRVDVENDWVKWDAGYRLPTEAEWEKAARGGLSGRRFPWGDTISHSQANYLSFTALSYDVSPTLGYHPDYAVGDPPYTSPVGSFAPNGYGLYDMAGNVWEWCWDWYDRSYYSRSPQVDPRGPTDSERWYRVVRGGDWYNGARDCRVASRCFNCPHFSYITYGFRSVLPVGP